MRGLLRLLCALGFHNSKGEYRPYPKAMPHIKLRMCTRCGYSEWR